MARAILTDAMARGGATDTIARNLVGRIDRATGRRAGGVIGLTTNQAWAVNGARLELESGDPARLAAYLGRARRDRRFDGLVNRAIAGTERLSAIDVDRMVDRYSDRLLYLRGQTIARTETIAAYNNAADEALRQVVDTGQVHPDRIMQVWRSASDEKVRESHAALEGEARGLDEPFSNGLKFPHDPSGPAEEVINCRCILEPQIDYLSNIDAGLAAAPGRDSPRFDPLPGAPADLFTPRAKTESPA